MSDDVVRRVGDEGRVVVRQQSSVVGQEIEQMWHLLEVRRNIRVVPPEMYVVEL